MRFLRMWSLRWRGCGGCLLRTSRVGGFSTSMGLIMMGLWLSWLMFLLGVLGVLVISVA